MRPKLWPRRGANLPVVLELAPLVDCVFLLLMFFIVVSSSGNVGAVPIEIPHVGQADASPRAATVLSIGQDDKIFWDGAEVSDGELQERLTAQAAEGGPLRLTGDHRSSLGTLMRVYQMCRVAGVPRIDVDVSLEEASEEAPPGR
ncbi:MAG: biopolymer transporter ExbD [Planctomycetes bacterium]|nr:biopolymer transporter ExbD [Planctomycetota bacterium]